MDVKIKLSELLKDLADRRKHITNISRLNEEELKQLLDKCSSSSFNMFVMDKNGNIDVRTDIKVPFDMLDEEDIISYSRTFIMDDTIIDVSKDNKKLSKLLNTIKTAFINKEKNFSICV